MRRVLCFDPGESLKLPAPALYPEWEVGLRQFPGMDFERFRVEIGIAYAEYAHPPELWLLVPHTMSEEEIAANQKALRELIYDITNADPDGFKILRWGAGRVGSLEGRLTLELEFTGESNKAQEYLLPLSLRAYFEIVKFLARAELRNNLTTIRLRANPNTITPVIEDIAACLDRAAGAAKHEKQQLASENSKQKYFNSEHISCGLSLTKTEFERPQLPWLYRITRDERAISGWLRDGTEKIANNWDDFHLQLNDWYKQKLMTINGYGPGDLGKEPPERLRIQLAGQLVKLQENQGKAAAPVDLRREITTLIEQEETRLFQAIQKRPTPMLYYAPTVLAAVLAGLFTGPAAALIAQPAGSPWMWPIVTLVALLLASGLLLVALQVVKWRAINTALRALKALQDKTESDADTLRTLTLRRLKSLLVRRNLDIVNAEIDDRVERAQQLDYHLRELQRHHHALLPGHAWRPTEAQDGVSLPELHLPAEQNQTYFWEGRHADGSQCLIDNETKQLAEIDRSGRYAGLTAIEFVAERRGAA